MDCYHIYNTWMSKVFTILHQNSSKNPKFVKILPYVQQFPSISAMIPIEKMLYNVADTC